MKMASTLTSAGYRVTVVARSQDGLPTHDTQDGFEVVRIAQPTPFAWVPTPRLPPGEDAGEGGARNPGSTRQRNRTARLRGVLRSTFGRMIQAARYLRLTRVWSDDIARVVPDADIWQAEELVMLPVALDLRRRRGGLVVYDSRDLDVHSARFARLPRVWRQLLERRERQWARSADALISASAPYAAVLARNWGREPTVVWNGPPDFDPPDPPPRLWHERLGLPAGSKVVLYLGLVMTGRGIGQLCRAMAEVPDAVLVVAGFGTDYASYQHDGALLSHADRLFFPGAVPPGEILPLTASADVAAMPVQGDTLNHQLNTPTKLFDAMGAGVPVVASDLPGMAPIVRATGCGELCDPDDPTDIARAIRLILDAPPERLAAYRAACLAAARGPYAWERQAATLSELYAGLVLPG